MATLGLNEMGKFLWEGREKGLPCWLSLGKLFYLPSQSNFPMQNAKKVWYYEKWIGCHASFPPRQSVNYKPGYKPSDLL